MSAPIALVLDATNVTVVARREGGTAYTLTWNPDQPDAMIESVRAFVGAPSAIVIVVGLSHLEIATPELPPITPAAKRAVLLRDADRYFPISEPVAVALLDGFAVAMPSGKLAAWVTAAGQLAPVRVVMAAPTAAMRLRRNGIYTVPVGENELGSVEISDSAVVSVRRHSLGDSAIESSGPSPRNKSVGRTILTSEQIGREAVRQVALPLDLQLLDHPLHAQLYRARTRRIVVAVAIAAVAVVLLAWSLDWWRSGVLTTTEARVAVLAADVQPAERALHRAQQAAAEMALLEQSAARANAPDAPLFVLSSVTQVLPKDTFVQRITWDGAQWRIEGTTDNAPRLVPLLDGDGRFRDVHVASPGQRFLDAGRQRESFAINFAMQRGEGDHASR